MAVLAVLFSLAIGVSLGLLGSGGSVLTVPVLHHVFRIAAHDAIATSLLVVGTTSLVAVVHHARAGRVHWRIGLAFGSSSMAAAFVGGELRTALPGELLIGAFACVMVAAGVAMLARARRPPTCAGREICLVRVISLGIGVGLITGTLGAGGGFIIVPALTMVGGLAMPVAVGTSLLVIAMNSFAGFAGSASHTSIDVPIAALVSVLAIAGSFAGARLGRRLTASHLQHGFGWLVIAIGLTVLVRELLRALHCCP